ncbi:MAG: hypothetical protein U9Q03_03030 [Patescibacteria group bacterium]|nr:hypothetical protein [Patescibacteria group bacterium]
MEKPKFTPKSEAEEEVIELTDEDLEEVTDDAEYEISIQEAKGGQVVQGPAAPPEVPKSSEEIIATAQEMPDNVEDAIGDLVEEATGESMQPAKEQWTESVTAGLRVDKMKKEATEEIIRQQREKADKELEDALKAVEEAPDQNEEGGSKAA